MDNVLNQGMTVFFGEAITVGIEDNTVTFNYTTASGDPDTITRPGSARYQVQNGRPVRLAPIALSFEGFINEWLTMNDMVAELAGPAHGRALITTNWLHDFKKI